MEDSNNRNQKLDTGTKSFNNVNWRFQHRKRGLQNKKTKHCDNLKHCNNTLVSKMNVVEMVTLAIVIHHLSLVVVEVMILGESIGYVQLNTIA